VDGVSRPESTSADAVEEVFESAAVEKTTDDNEGTDLASFARGGVYALAGSGAAGVLGFVLTVLITRNLPAATAGVLFAATSVFTLAYVFVRLGSSTGAVYFVARLMALGQAHKVRAVLRSALLPVLWLSVVVGAGLFLMAPVLARWIVPSEPTAAVGPIRVLSCFLPFAALTDVFLFGTRGLHRLRPLITIDRIGRPLLQVVFVAACIEVGRTGATLMTFAYVFPYLPAALVSGWWLWRLLLKVEQRHNVTAPETKGMHREFWGYTWARWLQSLAQVGLQRIDIILIAAISGPADAAVYAAVTRFLVFGQLSAGAIVAVAQPRLSRLIALRDTEGVRTIYRVSTTWLILATWPIYLGFVVFSAQMPLLFGKEYSAGTATVVILGLTMLVATGCGLVDVVLAMAGKTTWTFANSVAALVINVSLDLLLIPAIGITGAALGWSAAILFNNLVPLTQIGWKLHLTPFGRSTNLAALTAVLTLGLVPGALALAGTPLLGLFVAFSVALLVYTFVVWRLRALFSLDVLRARVRERRVTA
jgi:O-antigen/teichoic acid export membrane protein